MSEAIAALLAVHLAATAGLAGLTWFVQVVHYPLMASVGGDDFPSYEARHIRRTSGVVVPLMAVEAASAVAIPIVARHEVGLLLPLAGIALLGVIHASTALLQAPAHSRLLSGFDAHVHRRLVRWNWIRTVGWTMRVVLAAAMVVVA